MGEIEKLEEKENKEEKEKITINTIYFEHQDNYSSKKMKLLLFENGEKKYKIFQKRRVKNDIFYIPFNGGYLKIWKDNKGNILFYVDSNKFETFVKDSEIITVISCNKELEISGPLRDIVENYNELTEPIKLLICANFEF
jgi:hypothetical protein